MRLPSKSRSRFRWLGKHPALDLLNTEVIDQGHLVDLLESPGELLAWLAAAGLVSKEELRGLTGTTSAEELDTLRSARAFRRSLRDAVDAIVKRNPVPARVVAQVNQILAGRKLVSRLEEVDRRLRLVTRRELRSAEDLLVPLAEAASDLFCNADFSYIRKCENPRCILYFYDVSKNHARRWCSMDACGSQSKARAYYRRKARVSR